METYLSTSIEPDNTLWIIFASLSLISSLVMIAAIVFKGKTSIFLPCFGLAVIGMILMMVFGLNATIKAQEENAANLTQNIHTAYDVDDIKIDSTSITTEDDTVMWEATVYKGDTAYEVEIRQDEKTYEPTLISFESDEHIRELKK